MGRWRAARVYVRRTPMCDAVSDCCTVLPISEERPIRVFRISCLLFREITDAAKGRWCHVSLFFSMSTCELDIILWELSESWILSSIRDSLLDKEWYTTAFILLNTRRLVYQKNLKILKMYVCLYILWIRGKATGWLNPLNVLHVHHTGMCFQGVTHSAWWHKV